MMNFLLKKNENLDNQKTGFRMAPSDGPEVNTKESHSKRIRITN